MKARPQAAAAAFAAAALDAGEASVRDRHGDRRILVHDIEFDRARRLVGHVLVAMDGPARDVDPFTRLEDARRLPLDGEGDFALLDGRPLVAVMTVEFVAAVCGDDNRL